MMPKPMAINAPIASQIPGNLTEDPGLPERQSGAKQKDEITDEVEFQESHEGHR